MPMYTIDGLPLDLPEGSAYVDLPHLPGETVFQENPLLIEELQLPSPVRVQLHEDEIIQRDTAWRITVFGQPDSFRPRALPWLIWIADTPLVASESSDLSSIVAIALDPDLLASGGQISISYGLQPDQRQLIASIPTLQ